MLGDVWHSGIKEFVGFHEAVKRHNNQKQPNQ